MCMWARRSRLQVVWRWSLDDLEWPDEAWLELGRGEDVLKVGVFGGEANHVTNVVGYMAACLVCVVALAFLSLSNGAVSRVDAVLDDLKAEGG